MNTSQTHAELDKVFLIRQKKGSYQVLTNENKIILKQEFDKNAFPEIKELKQISKKIHIPMNKVKNWFVYQRRVDFQKTQKYVKSIKQKYCFKKEAKIILENAFRKSARLDEESLIKLKNVIGCPSYQIKRWFYYRNQKLRNILLKKKIVKEISTVEIVKNQEKIEYVETQNIPFSLPNYSVPQMAFNIYPKFVNMQINPLNTSIQNFSMRNNQILQNPWFLNNLMQNPMKNYFQSIVQPPQFFTRLPVFDTNRQFFWR